MQGFAVVAVPGGGGAVGVDHQGPAVPVDDDLVVEVAQQDAVLQARLPPVGLMCRVMHLARPGGLGAAARLRIMHKYYAAETVCA